MRLWLRWSQALLAWSKTIKSQQRQSLFINICFALNRIDWVKVLHPTQHKAGHFRDVLRSLSLVRKKLNVTQQKQTTQEQIARNTQKANLNLKKTQTKSQLLSTARVCAYHCAQLSHTNTAQNCSHNLPFYRPDNHHGSDVVYWKGGGALNRNGDTWTKQYENQLQLECGPMPNVMAALPNIGGALCSTPQSLADAHY